MHKLETKNLTMRFGSETIIRDISIAVDQGELVSLLGVSGSGKTTLFNCISGIYKPVSGSVILDGEEITGTAVVVLERQIGYGDAVRRRP